jgi:hypothetical protein
MPILTRRNLLTFAAGAAATVLIRIPWVAGRPLREDNSVRVGDVDQRLAILGGDRFWYLGSGGEVPHDIAERDRTVWKALRDQRTEPQTAGWRQVTIELQVVLDQVPDLFR